MKAITLWQPWAHLCVLGAKPFETRGWATCVRERIAIHAAARTLAEVFKKMPELTVSSIYEAFWRKGWEPEEVDELPVGMVVGTAEIAGCYKIETLEPDLAMLRSGDDVVGVSGLELRLGDFTPGRYAWELANPIIFKTPVPAIGRLGFWEWEEGSRPWPKR